MQAHMFFVGVVCKLPPDTRAKAILDVRASMSKDLLNFAEHEVCSGWSGFVCLPFRSHSMNSTGALGVWQGVGVGGDGRVGPSGCPETLEKRGRGINIAMTFHCKYPDCCSCCFFFPA
jgi:hypothetical protein